jgi:hypothetical protein
VTWLGIRNCCIPVIDGTDVRGLAEFYRELLGLRYRPGDEPPAEGMTDDADWLVLVDDQGARKLAFQQVDSLPRSSWPGRGSCSTGPTMGTSRCTSSPTRPGIRSASGCTER